MSDREFDEIFRNRFDSFEVQPSPGLWSGISAELGGKGKRKFPLLWLAAASIAAVVAAGVMLNQNKQPMKLSGKPEKVELPKQNDQSRGLSLAQGSTTETAVSELVLAKRLKTGEANTHAKADVLIKNVIEDYSEVKARQTAQTGHECPEKLENRSQRSTPESTVLNASGLSESTNVMIASQEPCVESLEWPEEANSKRKIKSVGDLVNFVVGKVDKRKDKIIEFTDEEEGSVVSGINLGLVHFKSRRE